MEIKEAEDSNAKNNNSNAIDKENKNKCYNINRKMISSKLFYFFYGAKFAACEPFMIVFLISIGLKPADAGIVVGVQVVGQIIGGVFWGFIADYKKCYRLVLTIAVTGSSIAMLSQPFASLWVGESDNNQCFAKNFSSNFTLNERNMSNISYEMNTHKDKEKKLFYTFLAINILAKFFEGPQSGFVDSAVIEKIRVHPNNPDYSFQRILNPFGYAISVTISNTLLDNFPKLPISCYTGIFVNYVFIHVGFLIIGLVTFTGLKFKTQDKNNDSRKPIYVILRKNLDFDIIFFMATVLITGIGNSLFTNFTLLLLKDINSPTILNSITFTVSSMSTLISFLFGTLIKEKIGGDWNSMMFGCFSYFIRFIFVSFVKTPWLIVMIQFLHAFGFGLFLVAAVSYIKEKVPAEVRTFIYSIENVLFFGVSFMIGNILGGIIIQKYNAKTLFLMSSFLFLTWSIVVGIYIVIKRIQTSTKRKKKINAECYIIENSWTLSSIEQKLSNSNDQ